MLRLAAVFILFPTTVFAGQPLHVSMAQCAGINKAVSAYVNTPEKSAKMEAYVALWEEAAAAQAGKDMSKVVAETTREWEGYGPQVVFQQDFKDWSAYCRELARKIGLFEQLEGAGF